jgi:hypothetical protein
VRSQLLLVKYRDQERAGKGLKRFHDAFLPEHQVELALDAAKTPGLFKLEDGWLACRLIDEYVVFVFECPDPDSARTIIRSVEAKLPRTGGSHER